MNAMTVTAHAVSSGPTFLIEKASVSFDSRLHSVFRLKGCTSHALSTGSTFYVEAA